MTEVTVPRWRYVLTGTVLLAVLAVGGSAYAGGHTVEKPVHRLPVTAQLR